MEIKICNNCNGTGQLITDVGTHQSEYEYSNCNNCNGTGRMLMNNYYFEVPFGTNTEILYETDSKIHALIQNLKNELKEI